MKSLTIHNLDTDLAKAIEKLAASSGLSQNKMVKLLLRKALGFEAPPEPQQDFSEFCGLWSEAEAEEFREALGVFDQIDEELWR